MREARDRIPHAGPREANSNPPTRLGASQRLDSPERVRLELELAGPMSRAFAYSIDYSFLLIIMTVILLLSVSGLQQLIEWANEATLLHDLVESLTDWVVEKDAGEAGSLLRGLALAYGLWMIFELFLTTIYFVFFETFFAGRTPGKRWTQLRVVSEGGGLIDWRASLIRNLLRAVDALPAGYVFGLISIMLSPRAQRLGDIAAGTIVVRERETDSAALALATEIVVDADVEAGFRFTREELQSIGEVERRLIRRTLRRADSLSERAARPIVERATRAILLRIGREEAIASGHQRDFLTALLQASERLL